MVCLVCFLTAGWSVIAAEGQSSTSVLITNDDAGGVAPNTASFYTIASNGSLSNPVKVTLGGHGSGGGYFAANRVTVLNNSSSPCVYLSAGVSSTIAAVQMPGETVVGDFQGSDADNGADNGIGMVMNSSYLYANFSTSGTIGTFAVLSGCQLQFISDITPLGLNGGNPKGMALSGNMLVVTYGDGSIQSFDVSGGAPVPNGDEQNSSGFADDNFPDAVVITADGHYAIFGDASSATDVEVSDISSGQLTQTTQFNLPTGFNSDNLLLSPDGTMIYVVSSNSGQVSAAFFDSSNGTISGSCISPQLNGFDSNFSYLSGAVTEFSTGNGSVLYVAEFGGPSGIGIINVNVSGGTCTLTEASGSPVADNNSQGLLSLGALQTAQPGLYSPTPGSTLSGSSATFQWYPDSAATAYWIDVGSVAGGNQYFQSGSLPTTTLSETVSGLPTNGATIYVTLYFQVNGSWVSNPYTFTAANSGALAGVLTTPAPGTTLPGTTVVFDWSAGSGSTAYWIDVGNVAGGNQYFQSGNLGNVLSESVTGLPSNGSTVYVTLYSMVSGQWVGNGYTYTAYSATASAGTLTSPTPGSTLTGSTVTFQWSAGSGASAYWLDVGSVAGGNQYYQSGNLGNVLSTTVSGLPTDGSTVYVTLYSSVSGQWVANSYTFTAFNASSGLAQMQTPIPGSTLSGSSATFTWSAGSGATAYWLDIGNVAGGNQYFQSGNLGTVTSVTVNSLPANGSTIYVTLYSYIGGQWLNNQYSYVSGP